MRGSRIWRRLLGVGNASVKDVRVEGRDVADTVVPARRGGPRCGVCRKPCPGYDGPRGKRRWRALDLGTMRAYVEAEIGRVHCPAHGVVVEHVSWAEHDSRFTRSFEEQVACGICQPL
ncbi:MAG: transposase family protein [Candidatus Dormibacteria bacterium]